MKNCYFDYLATTPTDARVIDAMMPYFTQTFGNSQSQTHSYGWEASRAILKAREKVSEMLNCKPQEIIFTSGATESNNWVVRSLLETWHAEESATKVHLITSAVEHSSVFEVFKWAETLSFVEVTFLPVNIYGQVDPQNLVNHLKPNTRLLSLMWVNNEIASINPIMQLTQICKEKQILFHTDATQALGKTLIDLQKTPVDLLSFSAHKLYGPKGIGGLFIRSEHPKVSLPPLLLGGSHERGLRSGTLNTPGIVGLGAACEISQKEFFADFQRAQGFRTEILKQLQIAFSELQVNGHPVESVPHGLSLTWKNGVVPHHFPYLAISRGSACHSTESGPSRVLTAIGHNEAMAQNTLRISVGRQTTEDEVAQLIESLKKSIRPARDPNTTDGVFTSS